MEKPGVDKDGNAIWNPDGERQRYAERQLGTLGADRIFVAATQLMLHKGLIQDGSSVGPEEVYDWLQWLNLAQLRKLSRIAKSLIEVEVTLH
jgi:hypothetical protein